MVKKQGGKIACGQCHKFFKEDELILDEVNKRYLCDGCYEPREIEKDIERDPDPDNEKCEQCGEYKGDCECDKDIDDEDDIEYDKEENMPRLKKGEARIERNARSERVRKTTEKDKLKSLIW